MSILECKNCGGKIELSADKTLATCEYCGSTMTLPKIDDDQRAAAFNRGNHFRRIGEFDKALAVYERIVQEDENDAEAHWCCALCRFGIEYVEDPATYEWLPTCHRASFDSFLEDVDYLAAVEHSDGVTRRQYQKEGAKIAEVQRGILATSQNTEPYDVFICYKESDENGNRTVDSTLAQDIYYQLTEQGHKVFFARITLEDVVGAQYEPYIFAALNSAKVMVVVGTKPEHLNAVWVKNEWSRFLSIVKKDRSKVILPCYRDMDPYDMPEQLSVLQSYDMSKIGFMQDLIRGIGKVIGKDKKEEKARDTVIIKNESNSSAVAFLKRGNLALEDEDLDSAKNFFEQALNNDPELGEAYFGKLLAKDAFKNIEEFIQFRTARINQVKSTTVEISMNKEKRNELYHKYFIDGFSHNEDYVHTFAQCKVNYKIFKPNLLKEKDEELRYWKDDKNLSKAVRFASGEFKEKINMARSKIENSYENRINKAAANDEQNKQQANAELDKLIAEAETKLAEFHKKASDEREQLYASACEEQSRIVSPEYCSGVISDFQKLGNYKDSKERIEQCKALKQKLLKEKADQEAAKEAEATEAKYQNYLKEQKEAKTSVAYAAAGVHFEKLGDYKDSKAHVQQCKNLAAEYAAKEKKKHTKIASICAAVAAVIIIALFVVTQVIIPGNAYKAAQQLVEDGKYDEAIAAFDELSRFELLNKKIKEAKYVIAENFLNDKNIGKAAIVFGKLGDYKDASKRSFEAWDKVISNETIYADQDNIVALKTDGTVVAAGECANDKNFDVSDWNDIIAISYSDNYVLGLKSDRTVVATGHGVEQNDISNWNNIVAIFALPGLDGFVIGIKCDGTVVAAGDNHHGQCNVSNWENIVDIKLGGRYTIGIDVDGNAFITGENSSNEKIEFNDDWTDIVDVSMDINNIVGLKNDGTVVAIGDNGFGQLSVSRWENVVDVVVDAWYTVGLKNDGTVVFAGNNGKGILNFYDWKDIVAIYTNNDTFNYCIFGLKSNGTVVATGENEYGQCIVSDWKNISKIYLYDDEQTLGLKTNGTVVATAYTGDWSNFSKENFDEISKWKNIVDIIICHNQILGIQSDGSIVLTSGRGAKYSQADISDWKDIKVNK